MDPTVSKAPRVGHKKSRKGCSQCKRRHVKCNEESPCSNCVRHGVPCSLAGGPNIPRDDAKTRRKSTASPSAPEFPRTASIETSGTSTTVSAGNSPGSPNPFGVLTSLIDRPQPVQGNAQYWQQDLQLMHHFMTHTKYIMTGRNDIEYLPIWQNELPKVAFRHDYLMHGLLGYTALHKAYLEPEQAVYLQACAVDHLDKAITLFRQDTGVTTVDNANARFMFTWLMALFAYAIPASVPPIDALAAVMNLTKGIGVVQGDTWYWFAQGPFAPILTRGFQEAIPPGTTYPLPEGMDFGLNHLDFMLGVEAMIPDERRLCTMVLTELKQLYATVQQTSGAASLGSIICFPKQDPSGFATLIKKRMPQALIILSYYCVLLDMLDERWWMNGWATRVLQDILGNLDENWKHWVEWPVEAVLYHQKEASLAADIAATDPGGLDMSAMLM